MTIRRKRDAQAFVEHLDRLSAVPPGDAASWWPKYVYHFTDIRNAVSILETGAILSRREALARGSMINDNASVSVISKTDDNTKGFARFYLRPRTPTQHNNEGIRPQDRLENESHCPVPVYFLLNAKDILTREGTVFTDGNLKNAATLSTAQEFVDLPWSSIYHSSSLWGLDYWDKRAIINHRHAEVAVPSQLPLNTDVLKYILCRSAAEQTTLLNELSPATRAKWQHISGPATRNSVFLGEWTYIETAILSKEKVQFNFNPSTSGAGPFSVRIVINETLTRTEWTSEAEQFYCNGEVSVGLANLTHPEEYTVRCYLDGCLAYSGHFEDDDDDVPF